MLQQGIPGRPLELPGSRPLTSSVTGDKLVVQRVAVRIKPDTVGGGPGIQLMFCLCVFSSIFF